MNAQLVVNADLVPRQATFARQARITVEHGGYLPGQLSECSCMRHYYEATVAWSNKTVTSPTSLQRDL